MGYRSDVSITMYQEDFDMMVKCAESENEVALSFIKDATLYQDVKNKIITMFWNCVKWYEDFEDVGFIESFIKRDGMQYRFIRVGEEMGDIEEEFNDDNWALCDSASAEQYINIDCAGDEVDSEEFVEKIIKQTTEQSNDNIEPVSETELFNLINA